MSEVASGPLRFDEFELDEENALLTKDLLDAVWGHRHVSESVLKTTISQARTALSDPVAKPRYIEAASRRGYRFIGVILGAPVAARVAAQPAVT